MTLKGIVYSNLINSLNEILYTKPNFCLFIVYIILYIYIVIEMHYFKNNCNKIIPKIIIIIIIIIEESKR